jgi:hypothetical protein
MTVVVASLALLFALASIVVCGYLLRVAASIRAEAKALEARVAELAPAPPLPPSLAGLSGGPRRVMVVEILNPTELAVSQVKAAALLGAARPSLLAKIVYEQAVKNTRTQLAAQGVQADVQLHVVR